MEAIAKQTEFCESFGTKKYGNHLSLKQKNTIFVAKIALYDHFGRGKQGLHKHKAEGWMSPFIIFSLTKFSLFRLKTLSLTRAF